MHYSRSIKHLLHNCSRPLNNNNILKVLVIGSGPSGLYCIDELLRCKRVPSIIHLIDRKPFPYGLLRYGVAPDHPEVKLVCNMFAHEVLDDISVTTFGLVDVGKGELSLKYLRSLYDAVFLCHGASQSKLLEIPLVNADGTDVSRACSSPILTAQQVVGWYNGDWEETKRDLALDCVQDVVIVGAGNVAIDIARILLKDPATLASTDITRGALRQLEGSSVKRVTILARRDILHAAFTTQELRELSKGLPNVSVRIDKAHVTLDQPGQRVFMEKTRPLKRFHQLASNLAEREQEATPVSQRELVFEFCATPVRAVVDEQTGKMTSLQTQRTLMTYKDDGSSTSMVDSRSPPRTLKCDLLISAIGYQASTLDNDIAPIDVKRNCIRNEKGRISRGLYVVGWAKRGPQGIVATNKWDAAETVASYIEVWCVSDLLCISPQIFHKDAIEGQCKDERPASEIFKGGVPWKQMEQWENLEKARGRGKFESWEELQASITRK